MKQLNCFAAKTDILVFQLGFNWKGDRSKPLFNNGIKAEMINFIQEGIKNTWKILHIGVAEGTKGSVVYSALNDRNIERDDNLGEFLNRPIFILKSLRVL